MFDEGVRPVFIPALHLPKGNFQASAPSYSELARLAFFLEVPDAA
jgi:hypothetical protein